METRRGKLKNIVGEEFMEWVGSEFSGIVNCYFEIKTRNSKNKKLKSLEPQDNLGS